MAAASAPEEEDYVVYGTRLQCEEELGGRRRGAAAEKGEVRRQQPVWKQEVTDSEGRRRFHGAFSGGFSAGFFNTVGSKEGWQPQAFASSRSKRSTFKGQKAYDFMDEDEKEEVDGKEISSSLDFDTFGSTAAEYARRQASQELQKWPGAIPGPIPDELIVPAANSIGVKLLMKMGWRHGRAIGPSHVAAATNAMRQARRAMLATAKGEDEMAGGTNPPRVYGSVRNVDCDNEEDKIEVPSSTPIFVLQPKTDLFGLGFDPFKNAPEFRENKRARLGLDDQKAGRVGFVDFAGKPSLFRPNAGKTGSGFGIGVLEELDEEDEDVYASIDFDDRIAEEADMLPAGNQHLPRAIMPPSRNDGVLPGFKLAAAPSFKEERFPPPIVPPDFVPSHQFTHSLQFERALSEPAPPVALPPEDVEMRRIIEGLAVFVARSGQVFEDLSKEKHKNDPRFVFLFGGAGAEYYNRKLWEEKSNLAEQGKTPLQAQSGSKLEPLDASKRGKILGELPLQRVQTLTTPQIPSAESSSRHGAALSSKSGAEVFDMFVGYQPFKNDPGKQGRFEQFLKDKYLGGLRSLDAGSSKQTELQRAQEVLEFENVCRDLQKNSSSTSTSNLPQRHIPELARVMESRFTAGGTEHLGVASATKETGATSPEAAALPSPRLPQRQEHPWRPEPILCKRFNLLDPFHGKPQPLNTRIQRERSVLEIERISEIASMSKPSTESSLIEAPSISSIAGAKVAMPAPEEDPVAGLFEGAQLPVELFKEKPVDLYKAIFSDDSDEDEGNADRTESPGKSRSTMEAAEAANAALNRLVADDFLESLGKELGLKAPPMQKVGQKVGFGSSGGASYPQAIDSLGKIASKSFERQEFDAADAQGRLEGALAVKGTIAQKQSTSDVDKDRISPEKFEVLNHSKHDSEEWKQHDLKAIKGRHRDGYESSSSEEDQRAERHNSHRAHRDSRRSKEEKRKHRHRHGRARREHKSKSNKEKSKVRHDERHHR